MSNKIEQKKATGKGPLPKSHGQSVSDLKAKVDAGTTTKTGNK